MSKHIHENTQAIIEIFKTLNRIPRCSGNEAKVRDWLLEWAHQRHLDAQADTVGNVLIRVPASKGCEHADAVVIQGHMDMVCEKLPNSPHDFSQDSIECLSDGEWMWANGTTLGADNGIAIAIGLALAQQNTLKHPPLELLFTVEEETGMTGAKWLEPGFLTGKILLNLDAEGEGVFIIGGAGGKRQEFLLPLSYENLSGNYRPFTLNVSGLCGGHSGVEIHLQRANAIQVIARIMYAITAVCDLRLSFIHGGSKASVIPRDAEAIVLLPEESIEQLTSVFTEQKNVLKNEYKQTDPEMTLSIEPYTNDHDHRAMTAQCHHQALLFLLALPHGVDRMFTDMAGVVQTSNNLAIVTIRDGKLLVSNSQRGNVLSPLHAHSDRIEAIAQLAGAEINHISSSPIWEPNSESPLIPICRNLYQRLFKKIPRVEVIHGGLECGVIGSKYPGMESISFGATLENPHSPNERLHLKSIEKVWEFMTALLEELCKRHEK